MDSLPVAANSDALSTPSVALVPAPRLRGVHRVAASPTTWSTPQRRAGRSSSTTTTSRTTCSYPIPNPPEDRGWQRSPHPDVGHRGTAGSTSSSMPARRPAAGVRDPATLGLRSRTPCGRMAGPAPMPPACPESCPGSCATMRSGRSDPACHPLHPPRACTHVYPRAPSSAGGYGLAAADGSSRPAQGYFEHRRVRPTGAGHPARDEGVRDDHSRQRLTVVLQGISEHELGWTS